MNLKVYFICIFSVLFFTLLLLHADLTRVLKSMENAGAFSICVMAFTHLISITFCGIAWRVLFVSSPNNIFLFSLWARYLRDSVGNIFGFIPATGEIASARELTFHGVKPSTSAATLLVDITAELISQLVFTLLGLIILLNINPKAQVLDWFVVGFVLAILAVGLFFKLQRWGFINFMERLPERLNLKRSWNTFPNEETLHPEIELIYNNKWRLPISVILHFFGWLSSALEIWVALLLLNQPLTYLDALGLQSLVFAARTTAFFVPWGAGIQEGAYVVIGSLLGVEPNIALALSLMKRTREMLMSIPGVLFWQTLESRRVWHRQKN